MANSDRFDVRVIACNLAEGTSEFREGALAFVVNPNRGNGGESVEIRGRSRGGRWITKWERARRLKNFRMKTIPPEHPRYREARDWVGDEDRDLKMLQMEAERQRARKPEIRFGRIGEDDLLGPFPKD